MPDGTYWDRTVETMGEPDVRTMQDELLRRQFEHRVGRSAFYRAKFRDAGVDPARVGLADLAELPFTTKDELRAAQEASPPLGAHAAADMVDVVRVHSSSGTSGRPGLVGITRRDAGTWTEAVSRVQYCQGMRAHDVVVHCFGLGAFVGGLPLVAGMENIGATVVPVGSGVPHAVVTSLHALRPTALTCTPSFATYLAEYLREHTDLEPAALGLRHVLLGAEPGGGVPAVRDRIAADYDAVVTESLGNADLLPVYAATCGELDGNHLLTPDLLALEVVDDAGRPLGWEDGTEGELVATHLQRECVPLVRFRTRDRVVVSRSPCPCGRTGPRLRCLGRTDDMLVVAGATVWPSAVSGVVSEFHPGTTGALEILPDGPGPAAAAPLRVRVEYGVEATDVPALRAQLEARLRARLSVPCAVQLVPPGILPRFEMKAQLVRRPPARANRSGP